MPRDTAEGMLGAYAIALRFLSKRAYAESRLMRTLSNLPKRFPNTRSYIVLTQKNIVDAIRLLIENGLLNDYALGNQLWDSYRKTHGHIACVQLLRRRGISLEAIERIVAERKSTLEEPLKDIVAAAKRKYISLSNRWKAHPDSKTKIRNSLFRFLAGRGYAYAEVKKILIDAMPK